MSRKLGTYEFPYDPPRGSWSGLLSKKSRQDVPTLTDNVSIIWGHFPGDTPVTEEWPVMEESFFQSLDALYRASNGAATYTYEIDPTHKYTVEIVDLQGTPWLLDEQGRRWYRDVRMTLKILAVL